jgi:hypothetical protein
VAPQAGRIAAVKIYPAIGIARLGNSPTEFFVGPEHPGDRLAPTGGYKDAACRVKRQAARFRVYGFDARGGLVGEVTAAEATITWTVHLANRKAAGPQFRGLQPNTPLRNTTPIPGLPPVTHRADLVIDPGWRTVAGTGAQGVFDTGRFLGTPVPLGEIRTDRSGRLLVLGGAGRSGSPLSVPMTNFANNDRWFDDVSDGPVTATVRFGHGKALVAAPAWVICPPPDFAPPIESITTLYDTLFQVFVDKGWLSAPDPPSLTLDVYPLLRRALAIEATSMMSAGKHAEKFGDAFPAVTAANQAARQAVLDKLNNPANPDVDDADMPMLWGDTYTPGLGETVTKAQYEVMRRWVDGDVTEDWTGAPPAAPHIVTPDGLTRAALDACVGGPMYPGIEASWHLRDMFTFTEPFRLDHQGLLPGDVTKQMALPWQADFTDCRKDGELAWWPAQRPDDVYPEGQMMQVAWTREIVDTPEDMVRDWYKLGFVVERGGRLVETERHKVCHALHVVVARAEVAIDEVATQLVEHDTALFPAALFVIAEGFSPAEFASARSGDDAPTLADAPMAMLRSAASGRELPGARVLPTAVYLEDRTSTDAVQRVTFEYAIEFTTTAAFGRRKRGRRDDAVAARLDVSARTNAGTLHTAALFQLSPRSGPVLLDGPVPWASRALRIVRVAEGERRLGVQMGTGPGAPTAYLAAVLERLNSASDAPALFDTLASGDESDDTELATKLEGRAVFVFALAQVRGMAAARVDTVRVLFRLFPTMTTGLDYETRSSYRRSRSRIQPVAVLGHRGSEVVSIPCFAAPRVDLAKVGERAQIDPANDRALTVGPDGTSVGYFGCWLDLNQATPQYPLHAAGSDGPFRGRPRRSVRQLMRSGGASVVAEIYERNDPVPAGASPASSSRLTQRSLSVVTVAPKRGAALATATFTIAVRASGDTPVSDEPVGDLAGELMVVWNDLPAGTDLTLYFPTASIDALLARAGRHYESSRLERVDHHTLRCLPADLTWLPLPAGHGADLPLLLSARLPRSARRGGRHHVVVHQVVGPQRRIVGSAQLSVLVGEARALIDDEKRRLGVWRDIVASVPTDDPWRAALERRQAVLAARVKEAGAT